MTNFLIIVLVIILYLRKPIKHIMNMKKINKILGLYNTFLKAPDKTKKEQAFLEIARYKHLTQDLVGWYYENAPSYGDIHNDEKLRNFYIRLSEAHDYNLYQFKKSFHPKFIIKDIFFIPSSIIGFLLSINLNIGKKFFLSCLTWFATILISAYATELRNFLNTLLNKFN